MGWGRSVARWCVSVPAVLVLAATPAAAAMPRLLWLPLCADGDRHWLAIQLNPGKTGRDEREHAGCAHFDCPRKTKLVRKAQPA
jgi:hypothetical protein